MSETLPQVQILAQELGYEGSLTQGFIEDEIRANQRRTVETVLQIGKLLLILKEMTPHGQFEQRVEMLGFHERAARRFMTAASRTAKNEKLSLLAGKAKNVAAFFEMITQDDDVIDDLAEQDDLERMSPSQVRNVARSLRKDKANLQAKLNTAEVARDSQAAKRPRLTSYLPQTEDVRHECAMLQADVESPLDALRKLFDEVNTEGPDSPEWRLRIEQVWLMTHIVAARAADLLQYVRANVAVDDMPDRIDAEHLPTKEEAARWLQDAEMQKSHYDAKKLLRQEKRDEAKPRGRGRPKGSTNKAATE